MKSQLFKKNHASGISRRNFLKTASAAGAISMVTPGLLNLACAENRQKSPDDFDMKDILEIQQIEKKYNISQVDVAGMVDLHVHGSGTEHPKSVVVEIESDYDTALVMAKHRAKAWVNKDKRGYTWATANICRQLVPQTLTFGSICLHEEIGGINPYAVEVALNQNAKIVWMNSKRTSKYNWINEDVIITNEKGDLLPRLQDILKLIGEKNACLATGHLSFEKSLLLTREARNLGVQKIMITHPDRFSQDQQKQFNIFKVLFNRSLGTWPWWVKTGKGVIAWRHPLDLKSLVVPSIKGMRAVGMNKNLISTDWYSTMPWPDPPTEMKSYIWALMENGVNENEIDLLVHKNPSALLDI